MLPINLTSIIFGPRWNDRYYYCYCSSLGCCCYYCSQRSCLMKSCGWVLSK